MKKETFFGLALAAITAGIVSFIFIITLTMVVSGWFFALFIPFSFTVGYFGSKLIMYYEEHIE